VAVTALSKMELRQDVWERLAWLYGDPMVRESANHPDLVKWRRLGARGAGKPARATRIVLPAR